MYSFIVEIIRVTMHKNLVAIFVCLVGIASALPTDQILRKYDNERYHYVDDSTGQTHLVDLWMTSSDVQEAARYNPLTENVYHLFTRSNPSASQPLIFGNSQLLDESNFISNRRTIVLLHGWRDSVTSELTTVLVPALLSVEDLNIIAVDWTAGSNAINYAAALTNTVTSGYAVAQFIDWLNQQTNSSPVQYHIIGHGLGGHQAGIAARRVTGTISIVTGLDPSLLGWINHSDRFNPEDGLYTEVIHTNAGLGGYLGDLAQVDFYPNGGESMPGCDSHSCDHLRSIYYFGESVVSGGFTGRRCASFVTAIAQACVLPGTLEMGGLRPKIGSAGVYVLTTNASPPFSQG